MQIANVPFHSSLEGFISNALRRPLQELGAPVGHSHKLRCHFGSGSHCVTQRWPRDSERNGAVQVIPIRWAHALTLQRRAPS
eukprot:9414164-Pyramimonas_sp.AAC.1